MFKKLGLVFLFLLVALATASIAGGIPISPGLRYEFPDCAAGGSTSQDVQPGDYLMRTFDADVFVCYAATCASGGERFASGSMLLVRIQNQGKTISCRSAGTGDLILTYAQ